MAGLKELRNRIEAIKSIEKITSAMKMVAAARLRHAQDLLEKSLTYRNNLYQATGRAWRVIQHYMEETGNSVDLPSICRESENKRKYLLIILSSDRGLCGSYNAMIVRQALARIEELKAAGKEVKLICLGTRAYNALKKYYTEEIIRAAESPSANGVSYAEAQTVAQEITRLFALKEIDVCEVVYSHFQSAVTRHVENKQILPLIPPMVISELPEETFENAYYESEPDFDLLLSQLMPLVLTEAVFDIMINSQASEQGARMTSMDNATRNAKDMISRLTLTYNRLRQSAITTELIEIIAGAEAV